MARRGCPPAGGRTATSSIIWTRRAGSSAGSTSPNASPCWPSRTSRSDAARPAGPAQSASPPRVSPAAISTSPSAGTVTRRSANACHAGLRLGPTGAHNPPHPHHPPTKPSAAQGFASRDQHLDKRGQCDPPFRECLLKRTQERLHGRPPTRKRQPLLAIKPVRALESGELGQVRGDPVQPRAGAGAAQRLVERAHLLQPAQPLLARADQRVLQQGKQGDRRKPFRRRICQQRKKCPGGRAGKRQAGRSEEHTSELQSL